MTASTTDANDLQTLDAAAVNARLPSFTADELEALIRRANREYWDDHAPTLPDPLPGARRRRRRPARRPAVGPRPPRRGDRRRRPGDQALEPLLAQAPCLSGHLRRRLAARQPRRGPRRLVLPEHHPQGRAAVEPPRLRRAAGPRRRLHRRPAQA